jgi:hypothetical protein
MLMHNFIVVVRECSGYGRQQTQLISNLMRTQRHKIIGKILKEED